MVTRTAASVWDVTLVNVSNCCINEVWRNRAPLEATEAVDHAAGLVMANTVRLTGGELLLGKKLLSPEYVAAKWKLPPFVSNIITVPVGAGPASADSSLVSVTVPVGVPAPGATGLTR